MSLTNAETYWRGRISKVRITMEKLQLAIDEKKKVESFELMREADAAIAALRASVRENMDGPADNPELKRRKTD